MLSFSVSVFFKYVDLFCASDLFIYFFFHDHISQFREVMQCFSNKRDYILTLESVCLLMFYYHFIH